MPWCWRRTLASRPAWARWESNPHGASPQRILSPPRLPVPTLARGYLRGASTLPSRRATRRGRPMLPRACGTGMPMEPTPAWADNPPSRPRDVERLDGANGGDGRIRTAEWGFCRPLPCLLATSPSRRSWSGRWDLNPRPSPWQGDALPLSYSRAPGVIIPDSSDRALPPSRRPVAAFDRIRSADDRDASGRGPRGAGARSRPAELL